MYVIYFLFPRIRINEHNASVVTALPPNTIMPSLSFADLLEPEPLPFAASEFSTVFDPLICPAPMPPAPPDEKPPLPIVEQHGVKHAQVAKELLIGKSTLDKLLSE